MAPYNPGTLAGHLAACAAAKTKKAKGATLEAMCKYLFETIPDVDFLEKNILDDRKAHELDLAFLNGCARLTTLGSPLILECKNHARAVGSAHVGWFVTKLRSRGASVGVLVSLGGITGAGTGKSAAQQIVDSLGADGVRVLVLTRVDIAGLATTDDLLKLLLDKLHALVLRRKVL